jgi:tRNA(His) 5'-end guanylyltransferase
MRAFEQSLDQVIPPQSYMVARLDGRGFTRLTKELCQFETPFDGRFRDLMVETTKHLMSCGFNITYGYTQSDEISLLFHPDETAFSRKARKYISVLAGEASAAFSLQLGNPAVFECRMIPLPSTEYVKDYFLWRQEDAHRNSLNAHCYWLLRKEGESVLKATTLLEGQSTEFKKELLLRHGIRFDELPAWQTYGVGVYYTYYDKTSINPITDESVIATRRKLDVDYKLPQREEYARMVDILLT